MPLFPYSSAQIKETSHQWELVGLSRTPLTHLQLLAGRMGAGGGNSWGLPVCGKYHVVADRPLWLDVDPELI